MQRLCNAGLRRVERIDTFVGGVRVGKVVQIVPISSSVGAAAGWKANPEELALKLTKTTCHLHSYRKKTVAPHCSALKAFRQSLPTR